jgi:hypothetical protein
LSLIVVRKDLPRIAPRRPICRINRATAQRAALKPSRRKLPPDLAHAIDAEVLLEHPPDLDLQIGVSADPIGQTAGIGAPGEMGMISRRGAIGRTLQIGSTP